MDPFQDNNNDGFELELESMRVRRLKLKKNEKLSLLSLRKIYPANIDDIITLSAYYTLLCK